MYDTQPRGGNPILGFLSFIKRIGEEMSRARRRRGATRLWAEQLVVRPDEDDEVGVVHETVAVQIRRATGGHRRVGAVEDVVCDNEDDEVGIIDEPVVIEVTRAGREDYGLRPINSGV